MENVTEPLVIGGTIFINDDVIITELTDAWESQIESHETVEDMFQSNGKKIYGYKMSFDEYVAFIGTPNCASFKVRFGYDELTNGDFQFKMIMWGVNAAGERVTAYCVPTDPIAEEPLNLYGDSPFPLGGIVAPQMAQQWLDNWSDLCDYESGVFKVAVTPDNGDPAYLDTLRGYNFTSDDFHEVIDVTSTSIESVSMLNVVHNITPANKEESNKLFGVMMASLGKGSTIISNFYDLSAPCPNSC